jgi:hypothetical protein
MHIGLRCPLPTTVVSLPRQDSDVYLCVSSDPKIIQDTQHQENVAGAWLKWQHGGKHEHAVWEPWENANECTNTTI